MNVNSRKVIIIGNKGYLGSNLEFYLENLGYEIQCFHRNSEVNLLDEEFLKSIEFKNADLIFFMVGRTGTEEGFEKFENYIEANEILLLKILYEIKEQGFKGRFIYPSTRLVYKGATKRLLKEDDEKETKTVYAANKIFAENILYAWGNYFGLNYTIYRICVPYGHLIDSSYSYGTMGFLTNQAKKNGKITLFGDGEIYRTFTHVEDICEIMLEASKHKSTEKGIYNIGGPDNTSLRNLGTMIAKKFGAEIQYVPWKDNYLKLESGDTMFDDSKLKEIVKVKYKHSLEKYIQKSYSHE